MIRLSPGNYDAVKLAFLKFPGGVTITSADPTRPAVLNGVNIEDSQGLIFTKLEFRTQASRGEAVGVGRSSDIVFDRVNIHGSAVGDLSAMGIRKSTRVTVKNSEIHKLGTGINHSNSTFVTVAGNNFHNIQSDGVRGGGSSNVTVTGNHFTDFFPKPGDHPDAIQFWTINTKGPTRGLTITDNTFVRGSGQPIQGVFIGNETKTPYEDVTVTGNAIIGSMYHGISVDYVANATIRNNLVQGYSGIPAWIGLYHARGGVVTDNEATAYRLHDNSDVGDKRNKTVKQARPGDLKRLKEFEAARAR